MNPGFFDLKTPEDLLRKLELEFEDLESNPTDTRAAFNFFVTAEHLPDWIGNKTIRRKHAILRICSQLANGGKHFKLDDKRHKSVSKAERISLSEERYIDEILYVEVDDMEDFIVAAIEVTGLAQMVLSFWQKQIRENPT